MPYRTGGYGLVLRQTVPTPVSKSFTLYKDLNLKVGLFGQDVTAPQDSVVTSYWDTNSYTLKSARLIFDARQTYNSGAELYARFNGTDLSPGGHSVVGWGAFDTGSHHVEKDVTSLVKNGDNTLSIKYHVDYPDLGNDTCVVSASLAIDLLYTAPAGTNPPPPFSGIPTSLGGWNFPLLTKVRTVLSGGGHLINRPSLGLLKIPKVSSELAYSHGPVSWSPGKGFEHGEVTWMHKAVLPTIAAPWFPTQPSRNRTQYALNVA